MVCIVSCINLIFVLLAHVHVLNTCTTAFSQITLVALVSESILDKGRNREEIHRRKILLYQTILVFIDYQYIKRTRMQNIEKIIETVFFYCNRKLDLMLKRRNGALICEKTVFLCNNCEQIMK